jgi:hypothetical protein
LADRNVGFVIRMLEEKKTLVVSELKNQELKVFGREQKKLVLKNGVLYRRVEEDESERLQLVLPNSHRQRALIGVHDDLFHTHYEDAIIHLRQRFFWPYMAKDLEKKIKRCSRCIKKNAKPQKAEMQGVEAMYPQELLSIDYLTIEVRGYKQNILVVLDVFTKFGTAILTKDQTAKTTAKALWNQFFMVYGFPARILSDQGRDFESKLIKEVCQLAGIDKIRTTPYRPSSNPVERLNRSVISLLRSLEEEQKLNWQQHLPAAMHAYNCCIHSSTGYSPYFLFFGRHPRLPVDLAFGIDVERKKKGSTIQYVRSLKDQLLSAYRNALENTRKARQKNKVRYDSSAFAAELMTGDRVLVRKLGPRLDSKISDKWEKDVYVVLSKANDLPVYTVQDEKKQGPQRTLHRNYLLPIGMLDSEVTSKDFCEEKNLQKKEKEVRKSKVSVKEAEDANEDDGEEFQLEIDIVPNLTQRKKVEAPGSECIDLRSQEEDNVDGVDDESSDSEESVDDEATGENVARDSSRLDSQEVVNETSESENTEVYLSDSDESSEDDRNRGQESLRRSMRSRKPPDRLNLMHRVTLNALMEAEQEILAIGKLLKHCREKFFSDLQKETAV